MRLTPAPALATIDILDLATVLGGCKKKQCPQPQQQPQPQQLEAQAPSGPEVSTNVSISGYGQ